MTDKQNSLFVFIEENNNDINLSVNIGKIHLENPVIMCSGTFGYGEEYGQFYNTALLGAVTTKSYSLKPEKGNPPPRICETPAGLLNSIGLQNDGIDCFIKKHFPEAERRGIKLILSLFGSDMDEFSELAYKVSEIKDKIVAIELNL